MKRHFIFAVLTISIFSCNAQKKSQYTDAIVFCKDSINKMMQRRPIPGVAVVVSINGKIVWSEGFGYADMEQKVKVSPFQTKFRIGSISKALTASALATLYENRKIVLDSSVNFYLPDYPRHQYRFTVRQLAGHIAGVRHYKGDEWYNTKHYNTVTEAISIFKDDTLQFKPGTKYQYTSHGFNLLSAVIEKAANENFLTYMQKNVFSPLGLTNTIPDVNDSIIAFRSRFYDVRDGRLVNSPSVDNSYKWAGGGFISTAEDINKFGNALLHDHYLKSETIAVFTTPQLLADGTRTTYGMGFASSVDSKQRRYFGHSGGSVGGTCDMVVYPTEKVVVVILTNLSDAKLGGISRVIAGKFIETQARQKK